MFMDKLSKFTGWFGAALALIALTAREMTPAGGMYVTGTLILALGLLIFFFIVHFETIKAYSARRSTRFGFNSALMILIFTAILGLVNFISSRNHIRIDFSETSQFTLAPQSLQMLKSLNRDVKITAFVSDSAQDVEGGANPAAVNALLGNYRYHNPRISFTLVDPERKPALAKQYGITQSGILVFESGNQSAQIKTINEQEITNALIRLDKEQRRKILFLEGHGEHALADPQPTGYSMVKDSLEKQGFEVSRLWLLESGKVPPDASVLVIAGPQKKFLPQETAAISEYLASGGRMLLLLDPEDQTELAGWLSQWGIHLAKGLIIDTLSRLLGVDFTVPVVSQYPPHEITANFNLATFFPVARGIDFDTGRSSEFDFKPIARTGENSWSKARFRSGQINFNPAEDVRGPLTVAAIVTKKSKTGPGDTHENEGQGSMAPPETGSEPALAIFGDSDFAANGSFNFSGNGDLFLNTVLYLAQEKNLISIRPKETHFSPLFLSQQQGKTLKYISLLLLPTAVVIMGIMVWRKRRRL